MYIYICTSHSGSKCSCGVMALTVRRSAVLFKSVAHTGIFVVEDDKLNLPGGEVQENESFAAAAVRTVKDVVGGWPSNVSDDLSQVVRVEVGVTCYFLVNVSDRSWKPCFNNMLDVFGRRQNLPTLQMHHIGGVCSRPTQAHSEVIHLFVALRQRRFLPGQVCVSIDNLINQLELEPPTFSACAPAAPVARPAAVSSHLSLLGTSTVVTKLQNASPVESPSTSAPAAPAALPAAAASDLSLLGTSTLATNFPRGLSTMATNLQNASPVEPPSTSAPAAPAALPAAVASDSSLLGTSTLATNFPHASPVASPAADGDFWNEVLGDDRQLACARGSGRCVRGALDDAGVQPQPDAPSTASSSRRIDAYYYCWLCNASHKQLRKCWECDTWACHKCSFWCTLCPKNRFKYNICCACHTTGDYLRKKAATIWSCPNCW